MRGHTAINARQLFYIGLLMFVASIFGKQAQGQVPVPEEGAYHGTFAYNSDGGIDKFVEQAGKSVAIIVDYRAWDNIDSFQTKRYDKVIERGAVPSITWESWSWTGSNDPYSNQKIIDGEQDDYIRKWAKDIKEWGHPIMIRWGHEMNGDWYPWSGAQSGGGTQGDFGDPDQADGPERYIAAYRHVHDIFEDVGADNVAWVWAPNEDAVPGASWNRNAANYYPGDSYVDWIGFDGYNRNENQSFKASFKGLYGLFEEYGKPMMIAEFASAEKGTNKGQWIRNAYATVKNDFPLVKAVIWFNEKKEFDWRINSSDDALQGYQDAVSDDYFLGKVVASDVERSSSTQEMGLRGNYPNPFAEQTRIRYQLSQAGPAEITVYDVLGRKVRTLARGRQAAGRHEVTLKAQDLPSGTYICRLKAGQQVQTQVMALVK